MKTQCRVCPSQGGISSKPALLPLLLVLVALFLPSCAAVQVSQDYDMGYAFDKTKTYAWNATKPYENGNLLERDELLAKRFKAAVEQTLAKRGFTQEAQPTYLVSCTYTVTSRLETDSYDSGFLFGFNRYDRFGGIEVGTGNSIRQYDQGVLIINIHSAATKQLVWKGTGTHEVFTHSTPEEISSSVNEMVEAVLAQFPPIKK